MRSAPPILAILTLLLCSFIPNNNQGTYPEEARPIRKWVSFGNSFSLHPITNFWWGEWGMAATKRDSDFTHRLQKEITNWQGLRPKLDIYNISSWERDHKSTHETRQILKKLSNDEDLILFRIGECVNQTTTYAEDFETLIDSIRQYNPNVIIIISGNFWPNYAREQGQLTACTSRHCIWCPLSQYCTPKAQASVDDLVYGDDQKWHYISDGGDIAKGVANHANNLGHKLIAQALFDTLKAYTNRLATSITPILISHKIVNVAYYDLSGRRIAQPAASGIYIRKTTYADGRKLIQKLTATNH